MRSERLVLLVRTFAFANLVVLVGCEGASAVGTVAGAAFSAGSSAAEHADDPPGDLPACPSSESTDACECTSSPTHETPDGSVAPERQCYGACDGSSCDYVCDAQTSCTHTCNGASCEYWCESGATCDFSCVGGDCTFHCAAGSRCTTDCTAGNCTNDCASGASCTICKDGSC